VRVAVVVQRYGADISGGAELHARYVSERLAPHADVEVLTTCATDYVTWRNALPPGEEHIHGVRVRRFRVSRPRNEADFGRRSKLVFERPHSVADELGWLRSEGPTSPDLIRYLGRIRTSFDFFVFFSFRYYLAWHGVRAVPERAVLVPTAERDPAIGLSIFPPVFRAARAIMYNSIEERALIQAVSGRALTGVVVGVGSEIPARTDPARFRKTFGITRPFAIYVGRIDANKGCAELFAFFERYATRCPGGLDLVLVGSSVLPIPDHPRIRHLGFLPDRDKFDALAAADVLIMPSPFESLSMVALEAWALGKPVLANGRCDVLRGQAIRSRAGLYYENFEEFAEALFALEATGPLAGPLGTNGREFFQRHYAWPVIVRKYLDMFDRLKREPAARPMEPLPGRFARLRRTARPGRDVLNEIPSGPWLKPDQAVHAGPEGP
jgi:glycosyltransferase involved in cell wall biosynthesis